MTTNTSQQDQSFPPTLRRLLEGESADPARAWEGLAAREYWRERDRAARAAQRLESVAKWLGVVTLVVVVLILIIL